MGNVAQIFVTSSNQWSNDRHLSTFTFFFILQDFLRKRNGLLGLVRALVAAVRCYEHRKLSKLFRVVIRKWAKEEKKMGIGNWGSHDKTNLILFCCVVVLWIEEQHFCLYTQESSGKKQFLFFPKSERGWRSCSRLHKNKTKGNSITTVFLV